MKNKLFIFMLLIQFILLSCEEKNSLKSLILIDSYKIDLEEPSGLSINTSEKYLVAVSDQKGKIAKFSYDGKLIEKIKLKADDLEGITSFGNDLLVISESKNEVYAIDKSGKQIDKHNVDIELDSKSGIEGISYNKDENLIYIIKEKNPNYLLTINAESFEMLKKETIDFSSDQSAIFYESKSKTFWLLSDEDKKLFIIDQNLELLESYKLNIIQPEGLAIDIELKLLFIVSDKKSRLYKFKLPNL